MFTITRPIDGNDMTCFIYTYKNKDDAVKAYEHVIAAMEKTPLQFMKEIRLGECKQEFIESLGVIEPFWMLLATLYKHFEALDAWVCGNIKINADDLYGGPSRYAEFNRYTRSLKETYYKDGKALPPKKEMKIEWEK